MIGVLSEPAGALRAPRPDLNTVAGMPSGISNVRHAVECDATSPNRLGELCSSASSQISSAPSDPEYAPTRGRGTSAPLASRGMTDVQVFVDPSCPWAWITSRWIKDVAPHRGLTVTWRSYCLEIRDDYGVAPTVPEEFRKAAIAAHAVSHRMLRIFEAARARSGEASVDALYTEWGRRFFGDRAAGGDALLSECLAACGLDPDLVDAADDEKWDAPILEAMDVAYAFGGLKTQTPTIVVDGDPPHGFKGPVMAPAPTGHAAVRLWDAIEVVSREPGFFEITRPRRNPPRPPVSG